MFHFDTRPESARSRGVAMLIVVTILVTMVLVATAVHLPVYYLPFIFAVDAFLDMFRTSTTVMGDAVGAVVVDRYERGAPPGAAGP